MHAEAVTTVREMSSLIIDVGDLLERPGSTRNLDREATLEGLALQMAKVPPRKRLRLALRLDSIVDGIYVAGSVQGETAFECRRCLGTFRRPLQLEVSEVFAHAGAPAEEGGYRVGGDERIDLEPMVRDLVVLALPLNPLCREDCRGLCAVCGEDLNTVDCGHRRERVDLRWEPLRRLRGRVERSDQKGSD